MRKISVIIPTYNRESYVCRAIESVVAQDYDNVEIIIADNASTDNTEEIVYNYLQRCSNRKEIRYYKNKINIGPIANFNKAMMEYSSGEYILIVSDDDYLTDKSYISKAMRVFSQIDDIVLVFANFRSVDLLSGQVLSQTCMKLPSPIMDGKWLWQNYNLGRDNLFCPLLPTIFSKKVAQYVGGFNPPYLGISDTLLFHKILFHGKVGLVPDIVANYSIHTGNHYTRVRGETYVQFLYDEMDCMRISAKYALHMGMDATVVIQWKKRMMVNFLLPKIRELLHEAHQGDASNLFKMYKMAHEYGEQDYLFIAMIQELIRLQKRT